ncbi:hypothetical protein MRX96_013130 [Rhipicephalus microplus]
MEAASTRAREANTAGKAAPGTATCMKTVTSTADALSQVENVSVAAQPQLVHQDSIKTPAEKTGTKAYVAHLRGGLTPQLPMDDYRPNAGIYMAAFTERE